MKDKMDRPQTEELLTDLNDRSSQKSQGVDSSRRRLFGAGLAAPVILSMSSRTAWGGALCAPSAFNSATFSSHHPTEAQECAQLAGLRPATWAAAAGGWPLQYQYDIDIGTQNSDTQKAKKCEDVAINQSAPYLGWYEDNSQIVYCRNPQSFDSIFGVSVFNDNTTLLEVLLTRTGANSVLGNDIEAHAVAALLNAASGKITLGRILGAVPDSTTVVNKVISIFSALMSGGGYLLPSSQQVVYWDTDPNSVGFTMYDFFNTYAG